jgi:hypothetical protein
VYQLKKVDLIEYPNLIGQHDFFRDIPNLVISASYRAKLYFFEPMNKRRKILSMYA